MDDDQLIDRALRAYFLRGQVQQPARRDCEVKAHEGTYYVVLSNIQGTLAVYKVIGNPIGEYRLRGLKAWPAAVAES